MSFEIIILLEIAVLLVVAKIFGEIAERLRLSQLVGEIIAGIVIGALHLVAKDPFLDQLVLLGAVFLFFIIGMETKFHANISSGIMAGVSALLSFVAGFGIGLYLFDLPSGMIIGIAVMSTSTLVSLHSYINIGQIRTHAHEIVIAMNSFDEIFAVLIVAILSSGIAFGFSLFSIITIIVATIIIVFALSRLSSVTSRVLHLFSDAKDAHLITAVALVIMFLAAYLAEQAGIALIGAFFAGLALSRSDNTEGRVLPNAKTIGFGFFVPLFFAYSALSFSITTAVLSVGAILLLLLFASFTKIIGVAIPAKFLSEARYDSILAGMGMVPRGEYAVIIVHLALAAALITAQIYTVVVAFALLSMIITPILLKFYTRRIYK
ncbi:MAG: cation:proton antiporter [Candidatus Aenigmarchaeota archaeon]|nr:cation:proton antiporter [Candidatus Aenigmarchaeota archaeon]